MRTLITGGRIVTPTETLVDHTLVIEEGKITSFVRGKPPVGTSDETIDQR